jgi:two-component system sensor histidine kinase RegB
MPLRKPLKWINAAFSRQPAADSVIAHFYDGDRNRLRLRTLVMLRWLAIVGQSAMLFVVAFGFGFHFNLWLTLSVILASVWLNIVLTVGRRNVQRMSGWEAAAQLSFDALQLALLLAVTGGLDNPFCLMLIAPATVAAANLPTRYGVLVVTVSLGSALALAFWALPLPWQPGETFVLPQIYRLGFLGAILIGIVFTAGYAWRAALEAARMEQALAATQAVLEKEHRLSALGGLAAAAAHELGTPLGTIQVVAKEMLLGLKPDDPLYEDAELLVSQSQRCRYILKSLSARPETRDSAYDRVPVRDFLEAAATPYERPGKTIRIEVVDDSATDGGPAPGDGPLMRRRPEWLHALSAFIENAADFARKEVVVRAEVRKAFVRFSVEDDGPGFAPDILSRLGEPYVSSRSIHAEHPQSLEGSGHGGMGLGLFIAKTLCEHTGAVVSFGNLERGGAYVRALWRRDRVDILLADDPIE